MVQGVTAAGHEGKQKRRGGTCRGQRPARTRKREDLPLPLGPMIMTDCP